LRRWCGSRWILRRIVTSMSQNTEIVDGVKSIIELLKHKPGALLPVLHDIQELLGYIPDEAVPLIADGLNLSRAEVHGVISFYHHFRTTKPGKHIIQVCRAEACQSMGSRRLEDHVKSSLNVEFHNTSKDSKYTLLPIFCLGNCACSPSIMIDDNVYGRVTPERFDEILSETKGAIS
jgi:formate dehydrogenase subunit gamma